MFRRLMCTAEGLANGGALGCTLRSQLCAPALWLLGQRLDHEWLALRYPATEPRNSSSFSVRSGLVYQ